MQKFDKMAFKYKIEYIIDAINEWITPLWYNLLSDILKETSPQPLHQTAFFWTFFFIVFTVPLSIVFMFTFSSRFFLSFFSRLVTGNKSIGASVCNRRYWNEFSISAKVHRGIKVFQKLYSSALTKYFYFLSLKEHRK